MSFWAKIKDFLKDEPLYASQPSNEAIVEGWRIAYNQQKDRADLAERRLKMLRNLSEGMILYGWGMQYGIDIRTILDMTEEEMDEGYGD